MKGSKFIRCGIAVLAATVLVAYAGYEEARTIGDVASNFDETFPWLGRVFIAISYLGGVGFGICSVYKFKQYKDNPTQIPVGTPFALLAVSICMVFLPAVVGPTGRSLFGTSNEGAGWFEGSKVSSGLPGSS